VEPARSSSRPQTPTLRAVLSPAPAERPVVVTPADVGGRAAWAELVRDGALLVLRGEAAVRQAVAVTPAVRAGALGDLPGGAVVAGRTAAWIHAAVPDGGRLDLTYPAGRHRPEVWGSVRVWQGPLLHEDTHRVGGLPVTSPLRTVVDIALREPHRDAVAVVVALAEACGVELEAARRALERRTRAVGRPAARLVLAAAQERLSG
jgi:hypothetical protein